MTATRPEGPPPSPLFLSAVACAEPHPLMPEVLCKRLNCDGNHSFDGQDAWKDDDE